MLAYAGLRHFQAMRGTGKTTRFYERNECTEILGIKHSKEPLSLAAIVLNKPHSSTASWLSLRRCTGCQGMVDC